MDSKNSIFRSLEQIESRISEKLTVENIASAVYFSKYHYQRLFREIVGDSVMEYVTKRRLTLAGRALLESSATIIDIALEYGYDSREGFTRSFKAYMVVSPTEYRKYGLAAISQKTIKERFNMTYSKNTDEIIRELNDFIAKSRELAEYARKIEIPEYGPFWNGVAENTDAIADRIQATLTRISVIAERPDEITNGLAMLKVIDDTMFEIHIFALHINLTAVGRAKPEHIAIHKPLCDKYTELSLLAEVKTSKLVGFFKELSSLIFNEMRKTLEEKIQIAIQKGTFLTENIRGDSLYIKDEISRLVNELSSTPIESVTFLLLNDCLFNMKFISLAAKVDIWRRPDSKAMFDGMDAFTESLSEAVDYFRTIKEPDSGPAAECKIIMTLQDIAYHANILLFYTKGEVEKMGNLLSETQKEAFKIINATMESCVEFSRGATNAMAFREITDKLNKVVFSLNTEADRLGPHGGAIRLLAEQINILADKVTQNI